MNMKNQLPSPSPQCVLEGVYLSLTEVQLKLGPFTLSSHPGLGIGHSVDVSTLDSVAVTTLRPRKRQITVADGEPPTSQVMLRFNQNNAPNEAMAFTVITDPRGGLKKCAFSLDVTSNYPDLNMSMSKWVIEQNGFTLQSAKKLPLDYVAQLKFSFWSHEPDNLPLDAWIAIQVGTLTKSATLTAALEAGDVSAEKLTNFYELLYYPASGDSLTAPVLGHNYPRADRHRHQLIEA
jgi:hypothetical protein